MHARVVHADVLAHDAAAGLALALVLQVPALGDRNHGDHGISEERVRPCGRRLRQLARVKEVHERLVLAEHSFHELAVDASVVRNAPGREVGLLGTGRNLNVPAFRMPAFSDLGEALADLAPLRLVGFGRQHGLASVETRVAHEVRLDLSVGAHVDEAHDELLRESPQCLADRPDPHEDVARTGARRQDDRIEAPDDAVGTDPLGEPPEGLDALFERGHVGLEALPLVVVERVLEVVVQAADIKLVQMLQEGRRVLRPENDRLHVPERHIRGTAVERIHPSAPACAQAVHEPLSIIGRDIGRAAR